MQRTISVKASSSFKRSVSHFRRGLRELTTLTASSSASRTRRPVPGILIVLAVAQLILPSLDAKARDVDGRYASSPLKSWFETLRSQKGPCCSDADGTALSDIDWDVTDGQYRVRIEGQWWNVPEEAIIKEPNRAGRTMVWPVYYWQLDRALRIDIRCFMPGHMT